MPVWLMACLHTYMSLYFVVYWCACVCVLCVCMYNIMCVWGGGSKLHIDDYPCWNQPYIIIINNIIIQPKLILFTKCHHKQLQNKCMEGLNPVLNVCVCVCVWEGGWFIRQLGIHNVI